MPAQVRMIPNHELHPFYVKDDESMQALCDSIAFVQSWPLACDWLVGQCPKSFEPVIAGLKSRGSFFILISTL